MLCGDEKSQIQALDRTQKGLPINPGRLGTMTHDYKRNGTTTLFAALNVAAGFVIEACKSRHRHLEWIKFLKHIDSSTDPELDLHLIADIMRLTSTRRSSAGCNGTRDFHNALYAAQQFLAQPRRTWFRDLT